MVEVDGEQLQALQRVELQILEEVDRVCKKLNLTYMLASGTALGAARHKGFIPWDDDIDIMMPRKDYNRFMKEAQNVIVSDYFVQSYRSDPGAPFFFMKVRKNKTVMREISVASISMHHGVYIDIFPIDKASEIRCVRTIEQGLLNICSALKYSITPELCMQSKSFVRCCIRKLLRPLGCCLGAGRINRFEDWLRSRHEHSASSLTAADCLFLRRGIFMDLSLFQETQSVPFESKQFFLMTRFDEYLRTLYGNYQQLPPEEKRKPQHHLSELVL